MKLFISTNRFKGYLQETENPSVADFLIMENEEIDWKKFTNLKIVYRFGLRDDNIDYKFIKDNNIKLYFFSNKEKVRFYTNDINRGYEDIFRILDEIRKREGEKKC